MKNISVFSTLSIYDEVFCKNNKQLEDVNYFRKESPSLMFDRVLSMPLKDGPAEK